MTTDSSEIIKSQLHDLVEQETHALDLVASWETLCEVYRVLEFSDPLSDSVRLEEFKWIIREMNKFLTRMRNKLMTCKDIDATITMLTESFVPAGKVTVDSRKALAFQKLRQQWITRFLMTMNQLESGKEEDYGWTD